VNCAETVVETVSVNVVYVADDPSLSALTDSELEEIDDAIAAAVLATGLLENQVGELTIISNGDGESVVGIEFYIVLGDEDIETTFLGTLQSDSVIGDNVYEVTDDVPESVGVQTVLNVDAVISSIALVMVFL
jgi:hypothetical protein